MIDLSSDIKSESNHCCEMMNRQIEVACEEHISPFDCADNVIYYSQKLNEYGLIIHDGGSSFITIEFCPFCGTKLPESKK